MKIATQAIQYYCAVTGKTYDDFFINIEGAKASPEANDELWLVSELLKVIESNGTTLHDLLSNKDVVRGVLATESRKNEGEFYTPEVWCKEGRKFFDEHVPNWHDYNVWDASCYTMDTKIFTRRGWVFYDELLDDDEVLSLNPDNLSLEWTGFYRRIRKTTHSLINITMKKDLNIEPSDAIAIGNYTAMPDHYHINSKFLSVTPDHALWVDIGNGLEKIKAGDLYKIRNEIDYINIPTACHWICNPKTNNGIQVDAKILGSELRYNVSNLCYIMPKKNGTRKDALVYSYYEVDNKPTDVRCAVTKSYSKEEIEVWDITLNKNHIFLVHKEGSGYPVFCGNCGMGNLMRTSGHPEEKLFLSTLREQDAKAVQQTFKDATVFALDFLSRIDYDESNMDFFSQLPPRLQEIFKNDEPLIFYMNPPYKVGKVANTDVARYMTDTGFERACYDIYYQFLWRVMNLVERFKLSNCYFSCFGPQVFFTGSQARPLLLEFEHVFEYVDGLCISAQEFSDTSKDVLWGITCSFWKSRGGYIDDIEVKKKIFSRMILNKGKVPVKDGDVLLEPPRVQLSDWMQPDDVISYKTAPVMTSHSQFKGSDDKVAVFGAKQAENSMGVCMKEDTLNYIKERCGLLSTPTTITYVDITEENFWRIVASYAFRMCYNTDWSTARMRASAPDTESEGYSTWLANSLVLFLFGRKSHFSSWRDIPFKGEPVDIFNYFFPFSQEDVKEWCTDITVLNDLNSNKPRNLFLLDRIEEVRGSWWKEALDLFDWCKKVTQDFLNKRDEVEYRNGLNCWDASFLQVRNEMWSDELEEEYSKLTIALRDKLAEPLERFGFVNMLDN